MPTATRFRAGETLRLVIQSWSDPGQWEGGETRHWAAIQHGHTRLHTGRRPAPGCCFRFCRPVNNRNSNARTHPAGTIKPTAYHCRLRAHLRQSPRPPAESLSRFLEVVTALAPGAQLADTRTGRCRGIVFTSGRSEQLNVVGPAS